VFPPLIYIYIYIYKFIYSYIFTCWYPNMFDWFASCQAGRKMRWTYGGTECFGRAADLRSFVKRLIMPSSHCSNSRSFHLSLRSPSCLSYYRLVALVIMAPHTRATAAHVLGVAVDATLKQIKAAYRTLPAFITVRCRVALKAHMEQKAFQIQWCQLLGIVSIGPLSILLLVNSKVSNWAQFWVFRTFAW